MYKPGDTIKETLDQIGSHYLVLPAIQREFVWRPNQIYRLFDSLMQGYPIGTFLYWDVQPTESARLNFFDFVRNYHERDNRHCPALPQFHDQRLRAVLDGQQRLTALNVGLRGTMAWKRPRLWSKNPSAYPVRKLFLDLLWQTTAPDEDGFMYRFEFRDEDADHQSTECWFPVSEILAIKGGGPILRWINKRLSQALLDPAFETLDRLHSVVHKEHPISYYEEKDQKLDKVLQVFIRMNDGGTPLSHSDLLLSIAVTQWKKHDAREEIHGLLDELNWIGVGFAFSKDLVLKAGLMLSEINVGFKVSNFSQVRMAEFEQRWPRIRSALTLTVRLVADFGFSAQNLRAHHAILPIAYYLYSIDVKESYLTLQNTSDDREAIRVWLVRSLLKTSIWGSGDTLLSALRTTLMDRSEINKFPARDIYDEMNRQQRSLEFNDDEIEQLADMQYRDGLTFALLSLLFPFVNLRDKFHVDHIFPGAKMFVSELEQEGISTEEIEEIQKRKDGLANLQLLPGPENLDKRAKMPGDWLKESWSDDHARVEYQQRHLLAGIPCSTSGFCAFYDARRGDLVKRIRELLSS